LKKRRSTIEFRLSRTVSYLVAALAALASAFLRYELNPVWGSKFPFITFYPVVAFAAWLGGLGPGLVATAVSVVFVLLYLPPSGSMQLDGQFALPALFIVASVIIAALIEALHRTRKRAEVAAHTVWRSEARLRAIVNSATDAIITIDAEQKVTVFNAGAEAIFGYPADEVIGKKLDRLIPERVREVHRAHVDAFGRTGISMRAMGRERILTGLRRDGSEFPMEAQISQVEVYGQKLYTAILRDVTERKRAEAEREELLDRAQRARGEAERANRAKDEFLAMFSHELRNPLSAIRSAVEVASLDESRRSRALEVARRQAEQLGHLIDDLLDVARITQGRITLKKKRVYLAQVIERAVDSTRSFIESRGLRLAVAIAPESIKIEADPARLEQVFVNLLSNAAKYTERHGRIDVLAEHQGDEVLVHIRDTGIGIAPEMLPRIWELFAQGDRALDRAAGGLGVGLTVARRLVELHGARIEAHSEGPGKGAEFVVILPLLSTGEEARSAAPAVSLPQRSAHLLLVEDNLDIAESLTMLLELLGHRVRTVNDGVAAMEAACADVPDVMLVDIGLPVMDGYEIARRVRRDADLRRVVLVALTGYGREEDKQQALAAGFDYHLVKPVSPEALHAFLAQLGRDGCEKPAALQ
jgi:PAS domain S-box-containing protein